MSEIEIKIKILEVNVKKIKKILRESNAKFVKKVFQKNFIYDNEYTKNKNVAVRIRQEGKRILFTVKSPKRVVRGHKVRDEYETEFKDFKTCEMAILTMGLKRSSLIEIKREYWEIFNCSFEIVNMPKMPIFIEIEGKEKNILKVANLFGYSKKIIFLVILLFIME